MSKVATIASLVRNAARNEAEFVETIQGVLDECDHARTADFFDRLNVPRSIGTEDLSAPQPYLKINPDHIGTYADERSISDGLRRYLDRHERKIKWHVAHPELEGIDNVAFLFRGAVMTTDMRLKRLELLLRSKDEINAAEWAIARELMNRAFLGYRNYLVLLAGEWIDAMTTTAPRADLVAKLGRFYEQVDEQLRTLEQHRERIEGRRQELTVVPEGFPPVRPPNYFGGDLLTGGPWKQYWNTIVARSHHFRETST